MSMKKTQAMSDFPSKEDLANERAKMEKFITDKILNKESLISEDMLLQSEAFDSLINRFMKKGCE
ncbi:MAG TPA: hypothetical protein VF941_12880 [Clostridia bacterium]